MTPCNAKQIIRDALEERDLTFSKLTARTVSFADLARDSAIFVKIHGLEPSPAWDELVILAKENGFRVETSGGF